MTSGAGGGGGGRGGAGMNSLEMNWPFMGLRYSRVMRPLTGTVTLGMTIMHGMRCSLSLGQSGPPYSQ